MLKKLFVLTLLLSAFSCHRKAIHKEHPELIGSWVHHDESDEHWYIHINDKSWGSITVHNSMGQDLIKFGENPRPKRWRYDDKKHLLTLRLIPDKFHVDQLPIEASTLIISEKDTIQPGDTYCILDGNYYKKH